jgi:hypothetical protein
MGLSASGRALAPVFSERDGDPEVDVHAKTTDVDRGLAYKNLRTGLIAGAIAVIVFALAWVVGLVY